MLSLTGLDYFPVDLIIMKFVDWHLVNTIAFSTLSSSEFLKYLGIYDTLPSFVCYFGFQLEALMSKAKHSSSNADR